MQGIMLSSEDFQDTEDYSSGGWEADVENAAILVGWAASH